jgi:hypothetical protein
MHSEWRSPTFVAGIKATQMLLNLLAELSADKFKRNGRKVGK